jgi:hypothetical protein
VSVCTELTPTVVELIAAWGWIERGARKDTKRVAQIVVNSIETTQAWALPSQTDAAFRRYSVSREP